MSADSRVSGRIVALVLVALGFAASCGQLLGEVEVAGDAPVTAPCPAIVTEGLATARCPATVAPRPVICEEGVTRCEDRLLQLCTDSGKAWVTWQQCASAALCQASDLSTVAACATPKCAVEQMSCEGNLLRLCTEDRTGWQVFDTCKTAAHCDAGQRQCLPAPCEPGMRRCNVGNLERCRDDQMDWEALDKCATNEVCEGTLAGVLPGATQGGVEGQAPLPLAPPAPAGTVDEGPTECLAAACLGREVKCNGAQLLACNEGQTDFFPAEPCATPVLCEASIAYTGIRGSPRCVRPTCDEGAHRCSDTGVLEICNADRTGYVALEQCIGPPFCNAVAADNGQPGCEDAPCESGEERCNGPQIQVCSNDRTRFDPVETCETRDLCNDDSSSNAFCQDPVCQRGPLSGTEFRCQGAVLQRCNDQHTGFDTLNTCATAGLCNAGLAFNGCQAPVCAPGQTRCQGDFVQVCNAQRTGFDNLERCAAGTCDGNAGRCSDPCIEGSARCNGQGQLEECRNRLIGREVTARCLSSNLCDANARSCRQPPPGCTADGVRVCVPQGGGVTALQVCTAGRSAFSTLDLCTGGEVCDVNNAPPNTNVCDACPQNSQPTCQGNDLVSCSADGIVPGRVTCPNGCQTVENGPDRCRNCVPGTATCDGAGLLVCVASGPTNEFRERRPCTTAGACAATLAACNGGRNGENCSCRPGVCAPGERDCNANQPTVCADDLLSRVPSGPSCGTKVCFPKPDARAGTCGCTPGVDVQCVAGLLQICNRLGVFENEPRFTRGGILCVPSSGGSGESAVSCNGNQIVGPTPCAIDCSEESGCAECDPDPQRFVSTCDGPATHTECIRGKIEERLSCGSQSNECLEVVCAGAGNCNPSSPREDGTPCGPGGSGTCEGGVCARCGDGVINPDNEECDTRTVDACPAGQVGTGVSCVNCQRVRDCRTPTCEDGIPDPGEACQPGDAAQACAAGQQGSIACVNCQRVSSCVNPRCGDGTCTPAAGETSATCPGDCGSACGDGAVNGPEQCEGTATQACPGQQVGSVACVNCRLVSNCTDPPRCGDGIINGTEQCDTDAVTACGAGQVGSITCVSCRTVNTCEAAPLPPRCGDGIINGTDQCDTNVVTACGDGQVGSITCVNCRTVNSCQAAPPPARCGDGIINGTDQCDTDAVQDCPGNQVGSITCVNCRTVNSCQAAPPAARCGDGIINGNDQCDTDAVTGCGDGQVGSITCVNCRIVNSCQVAQPPLPACGNGQVEQGETCEGNDTLDCPGTQVGSIACVGCQIVDTCQEPPQTDPGEGQGPGQGQGPDGQGPPGQQG